MNWRAVAVMIRLTAEETPKSKKLIRASILMNWVLGAKD